MELWLVERYLDDPSDGRLAALAAETDAAVRGLVGRGRDIEYLGSTAIPGDELCFCLFAAAHASAVEELNGILSVPAVRTVGALAARLP